MSRRLFGRCLRHRLHRDEDAALAFGTEFDAAGGEREQRMILAEADIGARVPSGAALAGDDVAGHHRLAAENLQPQPLTVGVAAVAGGSACFLMSHRSSPEFRYVLTRICDEIITSLTPSLPCDRLRQAPRPLRPVRQPAWACARPWALPPWSASPRP